MATFANAGIDQKPAEGILYANAVPLTGNEANLGNSPQDYLDPINLPDAQSILAIIQLTVTGQLSSNSSYIVMQTSNGGNNWIDIAGIVWTGTSGSAIFALSNGVAGANAFQQTRVAGSAPSVNFSNQCQLGGHIRFVGKGTFGSGSSSSSSGAAINGVTATIRFKLLGNR